MSDVDDIIRQFDAAESEADIASETGYQTFEGAPLRDGNPMTTDSDHGAEVGVDWMKGLVLHENDGYWHPWDVAIYGAVPGD